MKKNSMGILNHEGDIFKVHKIDGGFKIIDHKGQIIHQNVDAEYVMSIFEGKVLITTSDGKVFNISKEPDEAKPNKEKLVEFLALKN